MGMAALFDRMQEEMMSKLFALCAEPGVRVVARLIAQDDDGRGPVVRIPEECVTMPTASHPELVIRDLPDLTFESVVDGFECTGVDVVVVTANGEVILSSPLFMIQPATLGNGADIVIRRPDCFPVNRKLALEVS